MHVTTPPPPLLYAFFKQTVLRVKNFGYIRVSAPPHRSVRSPTYSPFVARVTQKKTCLKAAVTGNTRLEERKDEGFLLRCS